MLHAQDYRGNRVYRIHIPSSGLPVNFNFSVAYSSMDAGFNHGTAATAISAGSFSIAPAARVGGWEVTVVFDTVKCEIYCVYRRIRHAFGRTPVVDLLLPPITVIRLYTNSESEPSTVIVDPAGLRRPAATSNVPVTEAKVYLPGRRLFTAILVQESDHEPPTAPPAPSLSSTFSPAPASPACRPLRI